VKVAVVTGASSGVGLAVSKALIEKGWAVAGLARSPDALASAQRELGDRFRIHAVDVRDAAAVRAAFAEIGARHSTIDLLVNNAAVFVMKPFVECTGEEIDTLVDTNLKGPLFCTHAALAWMKPGSRIINIGSVAGTHGIANQAIYCASKYGLDGFSEAVAQELRPRGIHVTVISPGGIDTPLWQTESNPYPGEPGKILDVRDVASLVEYVAGLPAHVILKNAVVFPSNEWH
jgi:NAD(P)-dependent dehydrogenase (short-subunit alcohol dehydrogenase family)